MTGKTSFRDPCGIKPRKGRYPRYNVDTLAAYVPRCRPTTSTYLTAYAVLGQQIEKRMLHIY